LKCGTGCDASIIAGENPSNNTTTTVRSAAAADLAKTLRKRKNTALNAREIDAMSPSPAEGD
jgi:hypothetical protein